MCYFVSYFFFLFCSLVRQWNIICFSGNLLVSDFCCSIFVLHARQVCRDSFNSHAVGSEFLSRSSFSKLLQRGNYTFTLASCHARRELFCSKIVIFS